ncbi:MaoC family dehydratase [Niveibacterium umoris]|uniref:3-hydroxybutyryl-CoA dehydratase n=1 Tax=Niveibacterium umoris TaxID=1193620 RepID=A0A840BPW2_9RHOO|nr:MaoC family dehydratase [Niveibacterium umoris]MBB4013722.1 3-hydroxybutyryl-CoA dehydratase [Niveibacterium umoris]
MSASPSAPHYLDAIEVGQSATLTKTFNEAEVRAFAEVSTDTNPVHLDEAYAASTQFGTRIVHGMLTASLFSALLGNHLPGPGTVYLGQSLRFRRPVKLGDTVEASVTVKTVDREKNRVELDCVCSVGGKPVLMGDALVMAPTRPA